MPVSIEVAKSRIATVDAAKMTFNMASPLVSQQQKIDFLRSFVHPGFALTWDEDGSPTVDFKGEGVDDDASLPVVEGRVDLVGVDGDAGGFVAA